MRILSTEIVDWGRRVYSDLSRFATPARLSLALSFAFFLLALLVYQRTDLGPTAFNGPVVLADAFLHGRLDIANGKDLPHFDWAFYEGKYYIVEPPVTALVVLPGVVLFGIGMSQATASLVVGSINAAAIHRLLASWGKKLPVQVWLTVLFSFGTIYWWTAVNGGIWYFAQITAVLFMFVAIYFTVVNRQPFWAGFFLGVAYQTRLPTILAFPFFLIMFSDLWFPKTEEGASLRSLISPRSLWKRVRLRPLIELGAGLGIWVVLGSIYNLLRFDTPLHASYYHWFDYAIVPANIFDHGLFDLRYIPRHIPFVLEQLPLFKIESIIPPRGDPPYVVIAQRGMAIWATTPAFLLVFLAGIKDKRLVIAFSLLLAVNVFLLLLMAEGLPWYRESPFLNFANRFVWIPFFFLIGVGIFVGLRNKIILACWTAIIPIALTHFTVGTTGFPMLGYRFALDYYPFLFLLTLTAIGDDLKWYHQVLIILSVAINVMAVLWMNEFQVNGTGGYEWTNL